MFNKIIYILLVLLFGISLFLLIQNKLLTERIYTITNICNYKSLPYLIGTENNKSLELREMFVADLNELIKNYNKNIYFKNSILKNICKDIGLIENILDRNTNEDKIELIKKDCKNKGSNI